MNGGFYMDVALSAISGRTKQSIERLKKILIKFFGEYNLQLIIEITLKTTKFFGCNIEYEQCFILPLLQT